MVDTSSVNLGLIDDDPFRNSIEVYRLKTDDEILEYEKELRGWRRNLESGQWEKPKDNSKNRFGITDDCVDFIIGRMKNMFTKSILQANLSGTYGREHYEVAIINFMNAFDWNLVVNSSRYNLKFEDRNIISHEFEEKLRLLLTRTFEDGERGRDAKENFNHSDNMNSDDKLFK